MSLLLESRYCLLPILHAGDMKLLPEFRQRCRRMHSKLQDLKNKGRSLNELKWFRTKSFNNAWWTLAHAPWPFLETALTLMLDDDDLQEIRRQLLILHVNQDKYQKLVQFSQYYTQPCSEDDLCEIARTDDIWLLNELVTRRFGGWEKIDFIQDLNDFAADPDLNMDKQQIMVPFLETKKTEINTIHKES